MTILEQWHNFTAAAAAWLACFVRWALRYLPFYWRPRADGKAG